ncbi:MAG: SDR family NAD(P)-dependent oxidoreductase [Longimicrobiales bacterium]
MTGAAIGAGGTAGHALLLYTGQGFLLAAGLMLGLSLTALAAGLWVGVPDSVHRPGRARWIWAVVALGLASIFATLWDAMPPLRESATAGALAALFLLAQPAYASGVVLAGTAWDARRGAWVAPAALLGAAIGVAMSATALIPRYEAGTIYLGASALVAAGAALVSIGTSRTTERGADMQGRVAIISGVGERGQAGYTIAQRFVTAGASVLITSRGEGVHDLARDLGPGIVGVSADLTVEADVDRILDTVRQRFGRLDALINVAGGLSVIKPLSDTSAEEWRREIQRNAETALSMCRAALPLLRESRGSIVNFAAPAGQRAVKELGAYSAAKAAVIALTRALALEELPHGVRVNAIAPGMIDTEQNRKSVADPDRTKWVSRESIAEVALFLASPASSAVTGETILALGDGLR